MNPIQFIYRLWNFQFNSSLARSFLKLFFKKGATYRIFFGPLKGAKLQYDPSINFHVMLGLWEIESYRFLENFLTKTGFWKKPFVVADVGANIGYFSLWMSKRATTNQSLIHAFEPVPGILKFLEKNIQTNDAKNIRVVPAAVGERSGKVSFFIGEHHHQSSLDAEWAKGRQSQVEKVEVQAVSLDEYFLKNPPFPDLIKVDIEGGGVFALPGMSQCIEKKQPIFWIESHTPQEDRAISDLVLKHGYQAYRLQTHSAVSSPEKIHPDANGIWGTLLLLPKSSWQSHKNLLPLKRVS